MGDTVIAHDWQATADHENEYVKMRCPSCGTALGFTIGAHKTFEKLYGHDRCDCMCGQLGPSMRQLEADIGA